MLPYTSENWPTSIQNGWHVFSEWTEKRVSCWPGLFGQPRHSMWFYVKSRRLLPDLSSRPAPSDGLHGHAPVTLSGILLPVASLLRCAQILLRRLSLLCKNNHLPNLAWGSWFFSSQSFHFSLTTVSCRLHWDKVKPAEQKNQSDSFLPHKSHNLPSFQNFISHVKKTRDDLISCALLF